MLQSLSVVILAYNEEANVAKSINHVSAVLKKLKLKDYEIILVNDGSKDKTGEIAQSLVKTTPHLRVITNNPNRGYGGALKTGLYGATKDFVAITHADNQFDFSEITLLMQRQAETDADLVCGIREGGGVDPLHRRLNRWGWNTAVRALFGYLATDVDSGFKLYRRSILQHLHTPAERGAMIDTQLLASIRARGYKVTEIPVTHLPRTAGKSTGANLRVIVQSFIDLFTFWWQLKREILVEKGLAVFRWEALLLLVILLLAGFSRLYRIDEYMTFLGDEGRDARIMRDIVQGTHLPLLGPGTSIGSMYLGPLYYYLVAPSMLLRPPVGPAIEVAAFSLLTIALLWWAGRQWFGRTAALAIALLYALSPTVITYSRSSWNPNVMPFFALLAIYSMWKVWRYGYWRWLIVAAIAVAFALNSHYLGLLLLPPLALFWLLSPKTSGWRRSTLLAAGAFLLLLSPLALFDIRHDFLNSQAVFKFFTNREQTVNLKAYKAVPQLWPLWQTIVGSLLTAKDSVFTPAVAAALAALVPLALWLKKNRRDFAYVTAFVLTGLVGLGLYKQHIYDHYFGFLFPSLFLLVGFVLGWLDAVRYLRPVLLAVLLFLTVLLISHHPLQYAPNNQLAHTRVVAYDIATRAGGRPFNFALLADSNYDESYRYFIEETKAPLYTIHDQLTDQLFVVCERTSCQPINSDKWEIAAFGWAKVADHWSYPWGVQGFRLVHTQ